MGILEQIFEKIRPCWDSKLGWLVFSAVALFSCLAGGLSSDLKVFSTQFIVYLLMALGLVNTVWIYDHRVSKIERNKAGLVFAIFAEDRAEESRIRSDFIDQINELFSGDGSNKIQVKVLPRFLIDRLHRRVSTIEEILNRTRANLLISGTARRRVVDNQEIHVLDLTVTARHSPISEGDSRQLSTVMGEIFPKRINVAVDGDFMHFEVTSKWVNLSARYIFAVASAIAGNLEAAQEMMLGVESDLKRADSSARFLQPLNKHVPAQILGILDARRHDLALKHYLKRDDRFVRMNEPIVDEILKRDSANYSAKTTKAIAHFLLRRDVRSARQVLNSCKSEDDATYMYGLAFLAAYEQKFVEAEKCYFKAFRLPHRSATVAVETEEFIVDIICKEPQREYLYFGTGLINHYVKKDYGAAARDYDKFMSCGLGEEHASFIARFKKKHLVDLEHKKNG